MDNLMLRAGFYCGLSQRSFWFLPMIMKVLEYLKLCGRALIFGDKRYGFICWRSGVQVHGPVSKILIGDDEIENWEKHIDVMVSRFPIMG